MIKYIVGDIFESPAQVVVNTVNTVGVMGKGIAKEYKTRYPEMFQLYQQACKTKRLSIGKLMLWYGDDRWVLNFPTKEHWRGKSKIEYIEKGLQEFCDKYADYNIVSVAFPKLGCGNGGLDWKDVKKLMEKYLCPLPIDIYIYLDNLVKPEKNNKYQRLKAKDFSFEGLKSDILNACLMEPISLRYLENLWSFNWIFDKGIEVTSEDELYSICLLESGIQAVWDYVKEELVFSEDKYNKANNLVFELLCFMGYLSKVKLQNEDMKMDTGFQLNDAKRRLYIYGGG
ncbi:MAG: macro domain-containing protein [Parasporobacterium sp.]|nr:macro domain-containing protein [Parasporobacterium sp.]